MNTYKSASVKVKSLEELQKEREVSKSTENVSKERGEVLMKKGEVLTKKGEVLTKKEGDSKDVALDLRKELLKRMLAEQKALRERRASETAEEGGQTIADSNDPRPLVGEHHQSGQHKRSQTAPILARLGSVKVIAPPPREDGERVVSVKDRLGRRKRRKSRESREVKEDTGRRSPGRRKRPSPVRTVGRRTTKSNVCININVQCIGHSLLTQYSETSDSERGQTAQQRQAESTLDLVYTLYRKSPLKEDNLSTKDKTAGPKGVLIKRFHLIFASPV